MRCALLALGLVACDPLPPVLPRHYDLDQPLAFSRTAALDMAMQGAGLSADFDRALAHAVSVLGTTIGDTTGNPAIVLDFQTDGCGPDFAAYANQDEVLFCAGTLRYVDSFPLLQWTVMHELGHVMGAVHLPCSDMAIMSAPCPLPVDAINPPGGLAYAAPDVPDICRLSQGGICR